MPSDWTPEELITVGIVLILVCVYVAYHVLRAACGLVSGRRRRRR